MVIALLVVLEDSLLNPSNPYAASKVAADHFVNSYVRTYNIDAVILRLPTIMVYVSTLRN